MSLLPFRAFQNEVLGQFEKLGQDDFIPFRHTIKKIAISSVFVPEAVDDFPQDSAAMFTCNAEQGGPK